MVGLRYQAKGPGIPGVFETGRGQSPPFLVAASCQRPPPRDGVRIWLVDVPFPPAKELSWRKVPPGFLVSPAAGSG